MNAKIADRFLKMFRRGLDDRRDGNVFVQPGGLKSQIACDRVGEFHDAAHFGVDQSVLNTFDFVNLSTNEREADPSALMAKLVRCQAAVKHFV